ncbi:MULTISPECIES: cell wall metabolism sensor histidine kinase WalK [Bacillus cereus group]|uniref:sensor histidine kinase n=1 Tax=Bacillus cereus group TaxID=86661 RepID=UPI000B498EBE|nr:MULTISPECIES: HAMP domain-containing sensor histidine kinase [Bacillus cereus group]MDH4423798.1 HAMP domain-containing sensor histidine kinase [Bacillus cereus]
MKRKKKKRRSLLSIFILNYIATIIITFISIFIFLSYMFTGLLSELPAESPKSPLFTKNIVERDGWIEIIRDGHMIYTVGKKEDSGDLPQYSNDFTGLKFAIGPFIGEDGHSYQCIVKFPEKHGEWGLITRIWPALLLAITFFLIANGIVIFLSIRKLSKPLKEIKQGIKGMTEENKTVQLDFRTYREIEEIKDAFNYMVIELGQANEEKRKSEESKKKMLRDISHDIKTPMTSIMGYSKTLVEQTIEQEKQKLYLNYIYHKSSQLNKLIENLFYLTKLDTSYELQLKKENFTELMKETIVIYYGEIEEKDFELDLLIPDEPIYLNIDARQMQRAIGNIIANALKYNPVQTILSIILRKENEMIIIQITDNGVGMNEDVTNGIFHEFVRGDAARSNDGGSGLGLAISKRIIELHNGHITVNSKLNEGTTFTILLPIPYDYSNHR